MKFSAARVLTFLIAVGSLIATTPSEARFLQVDPIGYEDNMNMYSYVNNDPINLTDPFGECAYDQDGNAVSGVCARDGDQGAQELVDTQLADADSILGQLDQMTQESGDIVWVDSAASKQDRTTTGGTRYRNTETGEVERTEYRISVYTGTETQEVIGTDGSGFREIAGPLDEKLEHEGSHVLDYVQGAPAAGTGTIEASGALAPIGEARAINRTNVYRRNKGRNYQRINHNSRRQ